MWPVWLHIIKYLSLQCYSVIVSQSLKQRSTDKQFLSVKNALIKPAEKKHQSPWSMKCFSKCISVPYRFQWVYTAFLLHFLLSFFFFFWLVFNKQVASYTFHQATVFLTYCSCKTSQCSLSLPCTRVYIYITSSCLLHPAACLPVVAVSLTKFPSHCQLFCYTEIQVFILLSYSHVNTLIHMC